MRAHPRLCADGYKGRADALFLFHLDVEVLKYLDEVDGLRLYDTGMQCSLDQDNLPWVVLRRLEHRTFGFTMWSRPVGAWDAASGRHPRDVPPPQMSVVCWHCQQRSPEGSDVCLNPLCLRACSEKGVKNVASSFSRSQRAERLEYFEEQGMPLPEVSAQGVPVYLNPQSLVQQGKMKAPSDSKRNRQTRNVVLKKYKNALSKGFRSHAHRWDTDLEFQVNQRAENLTRVLWHIKISEETGRLEPEEGVVVLNEEKDYLDETSYEENYVPGSRPCEALWLSTGWRQLSARKSTYLCLGSVLIIHVFAA